MDVACFFDRRDGEVVPGSARVAEFSSGTAAIAYLEHNDWDMSHLDMTHYIKRDGVVLHECRLVF